MQIRLLLACLPTLILVQLLSPLDLAAQSSTSLGSSGFTKQQFTCRTYPGGEDVIIKQKGKSRTLDKKAAKREAKNGMQALSFKLNDTKRLLKEANQRIKELLKSPTIVLPSANKELERLKKSVPKLEAKIDKLNGQKAELKSIIGSIEACGKPLQLNSGSNTLLSANVELPLSGWQGYFLTAVHLFYAPPGTPDRICVSINGGPKVLTGVRYNSCVEFNDGPGSSHPVGHCIQFGPNMGGIPLGGKAGYYHHGYYDDYLEIVQGYLAYSVELSLLSESNPCLR